MKTVNVSNSWLPGFQGKLLSGQVPDHDGPMKKDGDGGTMVVHSAW